MTIIFRSILILISFCTTLYILKRIRKSQIQIEDSIFWILFSIALIVISIFPQIADVLSGLLGIYSTTNFVFLFFIFVLLVRNFSMTIKISQMDNKIRELAQQEAIQNRLNEKSGLQSTEEEK